MSELDKITTEVASSITTVVTKKATKDYNELHNDLITCYNLTPDEAFKLKEGFITEKNKSSTSVKLFSELMISVLDNNKKDIADINTEAVFLQNKKIIKELINSVSQLMRNYQVNEKEFKLLLLGKVLQSLQDGK
jgi:uncharacterized protein (UPF0261 family)